MSAIDPDDAPAGFMAVAAQADNSCVGCAAHEEGEEAAGFRCIDHFTRCLPKDRKDGCAAIFVRRPATQAQPNPKPNSLPAVWDLVLSDMAARDKTGRQRYGVPLQPHNGRDALVDAYQEALDLAVYLRQAIYERDGK